MTNEEAKLMFCYLDLLSNVRKAQRWHANTGMKPTMSPIFMPGIVQHVFREARLVLGDRFNLDRILDVFEAETSAWSQEPFVFPREAERSARIVAIARTALDDGRDADPIGPGTPR
jgi:hypothetical protein